MAWERWITKPFQLPVMPSLPEIRVKRSRTFAHIDLEYLGPLSVKVDCGIIERWIALFTCFTTKAMHLELIENLSAQRFLHILRRFVARWGYSELVLRDNPNQFQSIFKTFMKQNAKLTDFLAQKGMIWKNIMSRAPWTGRVYKRIIGLTKEDGCNIEKSERLLIIRKECWWSRSSKIVSNGLISRWTC